MKDLSTVTPENFRKVAVPLEVSQIKEFFDNKELFFLIDYSKSKIKGNMFLTYISNLDLPCEIVFENATKQEKFELLKFYMETRNLNDSSVLKLTAAQVMFEKKGIDWSSIFQNTILTKEECQEFINLNADTINRWNTFLNSSMLFMIVIMKPIAEMYDFSKDFKIIDDPHYVGSNVVKMFSVPFFLETYLSVKADSDVYYFKQQFEEYMFRGKNLYEFFYCPENTLILVFEQLLTGGVELSKLKELIAKAL